MHVALPQHGTPVHLADRDLDIFCKRSSIDLKRIIRLIVYPEFLLIDLRRSPSNRGCRADNKTTPGTRIPHMCLPIIICQPERSGSRNDLGAGTLLDGERCTTEPVTGIKLPEC